MQKLNRRSLLLVGFTLFSMFFGAGNLIFPPYLGAQAGTVAWLAFVGFAVSAIGLPVIGVIAVARAGCPSWPGVCIRDLHRYLRCWFTCRSVRVWPSRARRAHRSKCSRRSLAEMQCGS